MTREERLGDLISDVIRHWLPFLRTLRMHHSLSTLLAYGSYGSVGQSDSWWAVAIAFGVGSPWLVGIGVLWRRFRRGWRDSETLPSSAELARRRLAQR